MVGAGPSGKRIDLRKTCSGGVSLKKVLVVDDSAFARKLMRNILEGSGRFDEVQTAPSGLTALEKLESFSPDVITLDVEMPNMNGLETLARIMETKPTPVVMVSSFATEGADITIAALELGAVDAVAKPIARGLPQLQEISAELLDKITAASRAHVMQFSSLSRVENRPVHRAPVRTASQFPIVAIASSTGGPRALRYLIPRLSLENSAFYIVVQHLPVGFTPAMARDLNNLTGLTVREAETGDKPTPNTLLIAPAGMHCAFKKSGMITLTEDPPLWGVRPAADVTLSTAGTVFGSRVIGVVLTGMGRDGANGLSVIKSNGGMTYAEHESSCVIYGMPRAAIESGAAQNVVPLQGMPEAIASAVASLSSRTASSK